MSVWEIPLRTSGKARARLNIWPVFMSIIRVPAAVPRRSGGTAFIMELLLGELYRPPPTPIMIIRTASPQNGVV